MTSKMATMKSKMAPEFCGFSKIVSKLMVLDPINEWKLNIKVGIADILVPILCVYLFWFLRYSILTSSDIDACQCHVSTSKDFLFQNAQYWKLACCGQFGTARVSHYSKRKCWLQWLPLHRTVNHTERCQPTKLYLVLSKFDLIWCCNCHRITDSHLLGQCCTRETSIAVISSTISICVSIKVWVSSLDEHI